MHSFLRGRTAVEQTGDYAIVRLDYPQDSADWFRVINTRTGDESSAQTLSTCRGIVGMAMRGELLGSFDAMVARVHTKCRSATAPGGFDSYITQQVPVRVRQVKRSRATVSGYGSRLPTQYMVKWAGRWMRVYEIRYSNAGTLYIGRKYDGLITVSIDRK